MTSRNVTVTIAFSKVGGVIIFRTIFVARRVVLRCYDRKSACADLRHTDTAHSHVFLSAVRAELAKRGRATRSRRVPESLRAARLPVDDRRSYYTWRAVYARKFRTPFG